MRHRRDHQLRNSHPPRDVHRFAAEIHKQHLYFTSVVGIDGAGRIEHREPMARGESGARPYLRFGTGGERDGDAGRHQRAAPWRDCRRRLSRHRGQEIEPGGERALIRRQRKIVAVRKPHDADIGGVQTLAPCRTSATRAISIAATSSFDCCGQGSMPFGVTSWMVLRSPPITPEAGDTSLARIQSQPLATSLAFALTETFSVSAAKPITSCGRCDCRLAMVARMSGFSTSDKSGVAWPAVFLIFCAPAFATRQSATAAAKIATSTGSARSTACSISRAVSTLTTLTPGGSGRFTGPLTSTTSAPAAAAAAAMAWPCLPDERLAM